jgi:acyl carrier protein
MLDEQTIYQQLGDLFADLLPMTDITLGPATTARDIEGWDSFTNISIMVAVESRFGIRFTGDEFDKLADIGQLVALIRAKQQR